MRWSPLGVLLTLASGLLLGLVAAQTGEWWRVGTALLLIAVGLGGVVWGARGRRQRRP